MRVAVADALGRQGDVRAIPSLVLALQDNAWPVRVAGAQALGKIPSLDAVPALIDTLADAEGRMIDELIVALENVTGETKHANAVVWKSWWQQHEAALRKILADAAADNVISVAGGLDGIGRQHLLAGALLVLGQMDLDPYRPPRETPRAAPPADEKDQAADLRRMRIDAVGQAIGGVEKRIRQRVLPLLVLDPYGRTTDLDRRADYLELMGFVSDPRAEAVLGRVAEARSMRVAGAKEDIPDDDLLRLRLAAARGLARQGSEEGVANLRSVLDQSNVTEELAVEAARSLGSIRKKAAVEVLITALNHEVEKARGAAHEALVKLTGVDKGTEYAPWRDWWRKAADEFEPPVVAGAGDPEADEEDRPGTTFFGIESRSKHVVYILDVSGSMQSPDAKNGEQTRIQAAVKELVQAIRSLPDDATFNIIFYNQEWRKKMVVATKENKAAAAKWAEEVVAVGATNIFDPLERAFALAGRGTHDKEYYVTLDTIFFLSDGQPNRGRIVTPEEIIKQVARMNQLKKVKIHTIGVGRDHDARFMRSLAEMTGGTYVAR